VLDLTEIEGEDIWDLVREAENAEKKDRAVDWGEHTILIWNLPSFLYAESTVKGSVGRLQKYKSVILDLRGNPGGYLEAATSLLGNFIDRDIVVARPKSRKEKEKPIEAKTQGTKAFNGKLVVLVDSDTGSAAELFARVIQLEKRGTVIGDRTAGAVMQSRYHSLEMGGDQIISYGVYITEADLIMADGKSLEKIGVTPDEFAIPTAADLAAGRDPALSRAAAILGVLLSPEEAGKFFLRKWID
jgi:carboxyl-terminal processing protease